MPRYLRAAAHDDASCFWLRARGRRARAEHHYLSRIIRLHFRDGLRPARPYSARHRHDAAGAPPRPATTLVAPAERSAAMRRHIAISHADLPGKSQRR